MSEPETWQSFIADHFPGYLLPASAAHGLDAEEAARFLERITGAPDQLELLRAASTLSPHVAKLEAFVARDLPELVRRLPSRTTVEMREWEGGFHGRLDIPATLAHRRAGRATHFVTRARRRQFDLPENELVRAVAERLLALLTRLRQAGVVGPTGWGSGLSAFEGELRRLLTATVLREVPEVRVTPFHEQAAGAARGDVYRLALEWYRHLRDGLDIDDPKEIARVVADGALAPLDEPTRFELAVVVRLVQALEHEVSTREPGRWLVRRTLVMPGRRELAELLRDDGARVCVFYNQAFLEAGPCDRGAKHYLGQGGRMRPDVTIAVWSSAGAMRACVIEVKHSSDPRYLLDGFHEAQLYRAEYVNQLGGWPQAILVASSPIEGSPRREDDVVAVGWSRWISGDLVEGMLESL